MSEERRLRGPGVWSYLVCYGLYAVFLALCYQSFWIWRSTVEVLLSYLVRRSPAFASIYLGVTLLISLALFVAAIAGEAYLRNGLSADGALPVLLRRFARLSWPLLVGIGLAMALQELVYLLLGA